MSSTPTASHNDPGDPFDQHIPSYIIGPTIGALITVLLGILVMQTGTVFTPAAATVTMFLASFCAGALHLHYVFFLKPGSPL